MLGLCGNSLPPSLVRDFNTARKVARGWTLVWYTLATQRDPEGFLGLCQILLVHCSGPRKGRGVKAIFRSLKEYAVINLGAANEEASGA